MRSLTLIAVLATLLLLLAGCDSGGQFRVINQTSYPLYVRVAEGDEITIPAGAEQTFEIATQPQHILNPDVEERVRVRMIGETYRIYDDEEEAYTDTTTVTIKVGQTLNAYINPNRASFKVVNNSSKTIDNAQLFKHNYVAASFAGSLTDVQPGQFKFLTVDYATANNNFYYYAVVELSDNTVYTFGGPDNVLLKDQQFLITLTDPE